MSKRPLLLLILATIPAFAQPSPTLSTYVSGLTSAMASARNSVVALPQPKISLAMQHIPTNAQWMMNCAPVSMGSMSDSCSGVAICHPETAGSCQFNDPAIMNTYTDQAVKAGIGELTSNVDIEIFATASQYISSSATNITTFNGSGLNDGSFTGPFTGTCSGASCGLTYVAQVDGVAVAGCSNHDTFKWGAIAGNAASVTFSTTGVCMTGGGTKQSLSNGLSIAFNGSTGHTLADQWVIKAIGSDCPNGYFCKSLANYDSFMTHATAAGLKIWQRPAPPRNNLDLDLHFNASSTVVDVIAGLLPLYAAAVARYSGGSGGQFEAFDVFHEPTGFNTQSGTSLSPTDWNTFATATGAAIHNLAAAEGITVKTGVEFIVLGETTYIAAACANSQMDICGIDLYNVGVNNWSAATYYTNILQAATGIVNSTILPAGKEPRIGEAARPYWGCDPTVSSCTSVYGTYDGTEKTAIEGCGDIDWLTYDADATWLAGVVPWASGNHIAVFAPFWFPLTFYTSDHTNDNCYPKLQQKFPTTSYWGEVLQHLNEVKPTGHGYAQLSQWWHVSMQGNVKLERNAKIQ